MLNGNDYEKIWKKLKIRFVPNIKSFDPIPLPNKVGQQETRKVVRAQFIDPNPKNPNAPLKISIVHQKKNKDSEFEDCKHFNLSNLKAGEEVRMILDTEQTLALKQILKGLYKYCKENLGGNDDPPIFSLEKIDEIVKVPKSRKQIIQRMLDENYESEFWEKLNELKPGRTLDLALTKIVSDRKVALKEFKEHLDKKDWIEPKWQAFFERNTWIFGYGLTFRWVKKIGKNLEQTTTGSSITKPGKRPDGFLKTIAKISTTVFVDIKTPQTKLLTEDPYRPGSYPAERDINGGVAQIQTSISSWIKDEGYKTQTTDTKGYSNNPIYSHNPKGFLIAGSLQQFKDEKDRYHDIKIASFELFRSNLKNIEVITFDELYHRAEAIITHDEKGKDHEKIVK